MQSLGTPCILQASNASIPQLENMSVDLYLPAYNLAIEYDGSFYHPEGLNVNRVITIKMRHYRHLALN